MSDIVIWPWPQIITTQHKMFLVSRLGDLLTLSEIFSVQSTEGAYWNIYPVLNLGPASEVSFVSIADFGPFYVVCTWPKRNTYVRDLNHALGYANPSFVQQIDPLCGVCCNFNGQFIGGSLQSTAWSELGVGHVVWSNIGTYELAPERSVVAGRGLMLPFGVASRAPKVLRLMPREKDLLVFTDFGVLALTPIFQEVFTYAQAVASPIGINDPNHVAGDNIVQGYIGVNGEFWILGGREPARRGYKEFIKPMIDDGNVIVSYVAHEQTFFITNNNLCLLINKYGACHVYQLPSSVVQLASGELLGTFIELSNISAQITSDALDFGSIGVKSIESLLADTNKSCELGVDYKSNSQSNFVARPFRPGGLHNRSGIHVAALEFHLKVRFAHFMGVELTDLLANIKFSDQRFKRGTVPAQFNAGES